MEQYEAYQPPQKKGFYLDPRTKVLFMAFITTLMFFVYENLAMDAAVAIIPLTLLLINRQVRTALIYGGLFALAVVAKLTQGMQGEDEQVDKKQTEEILKSLNLLEYQELHPMSLSGGQKQRVAIGSAIASDKEILVFDEPTSGLDYHHMLEVADNLQRLSDMGKTLFIITHDPELIAKCCNYFVFIEHGKTVWSGGWTDGNKKRIADFFSFAV